MKCTPTYGFFSLEVGVKLIAVLDAVLGLLGLIWFIIVLTKYQMVSLDPFEDLDDDYSLQISKKLDALGQGGYSEDILSTNHKITCLSLSALFATVNSGVFLLLLIGIYKKNVGFCLSWFYIKCTVIAFKTLIFLMYLIGGRDFLSQLPFVGHMLLHCYGLWIVAFYIEELRAIRREQKLDSLKLGVDNLVKKMKEQAAYENGGKV